MFEIGNGSWDATALFDVLWCPVCGSRDFEGKTGGYSYCSKCNAQLAVSDTVNGDGYLVSVCSATTFPEYSPPIPGDTIHAKFEGTESPELRWWSDPIVEGEPVKRWVPAEPDESHTQA